VLSYFCLCFGVDVAGPGFALLVVAVACGCRLLVRFVGVGGVVCCWLVVAGVVRAHQIFEVRIEDTEHTTSTTTMPTFVNNARLDIFFIPRTYLMNIPKYDCFNFLNCACCYHVSSKVYSLHLHS